MVSTKLEFTGSEFFDILKEFQDRVKEGTFKKTVPYDIWKKLKITQKPVKFDFIEDYQLGEILFNEGHSYSEYFTEDGLIAFLYNKWVEEEKNMATINAIKVSDDCYGDVDTIGISSSIQSNNNYLNGGSINWDCVDGTSIQKAWTSGYANRDRDIEDLSEKIEELKRELDRSNYSITSIHTNNEINKNLDHYSKFKPLKFNFNLI